jgi:hypothetical protein
MTCLFSESNPSADVKPGDETVDFTQQILLEVSSTVTTFSDDYMVGLSNSPACSFNNIEDVERVACEWCDPLGHKLHEWPVQCLENRDKSALDDEGYEMAYVRWSELFGKLLEGLEVENESMSKVPRGRRTEADCIWKRIRKRRTYR